MARMIDQITGVISQVFLKRQTVAQHCNPSALSDSLTALVANQELSGAVDKLSAHSLRSSFSRLILSLRLIK
jgi:hypothetical protein